MMLQELKIHRGNKFSYYFHASVVCDKMPFNGEGRSAESFAVLVLAYISIKMLEIFIKLVLANFE